MHYIIFDNGTPIDYVEEAASPEEALQRTTTSPTAYALEMVKPSEITIILEEQ